MTIPATYGHELLVGVAQVTGRLLAAHRWGELSAEEVFSALGRAMDVDRLIAFELTGSADGPRATKVRLEWSRDGAPAATFAAALCRTLAAPDGWGERLRDVLTPACIPGNEADLPGFAAVCGGHSAVATPAGVHGRCRGGLIAVVDTPGRSWREAEVAALKTVAGIVAVLILRIAEQRHGRDVGGASVAEVRGQLSAAERHLLRADRLRAIGRSTSGIVHEFNNVLTPIQGFTELMLMDLDSGNLDPDLCREALTTVQKAIRQASDLMHRLRQFYRFDLSSETQLTVFLDELLEEATASVRAKVRAHSADGESRVRFVTELHEGYRVLGSSGELHEAFVAIIANAVEAIPGAGTVTVRMQPEDGDIRVEVVDDGVGMDAATCECCFDPFFTTKKRSGAGLGLAGAFGIFRRHGGRMEFDSTPGMGTTCRILLETMPWCKGTDGR